MAWFSRAIAHIPVVTLARFDVAFHFTSYTFPKAVIVQNMRSGYIFNETKKSAAVL